MLVPRSFRAFVKATGFVLPAPTHTRYGETAYQFFLQSLSTSELIREVYAKEKGPNPYILRLGGRQIVLTVLMQSMDLTRPVLTRVLRKGERLQSYRALARKADRPGKWYAPPASVHHTLGLPMGQMHPLFFTPKHDTLCLESRASDIYVDWHSNSPTVGIYRRGGGLQWFVPDPSRDIEPWENPGSQRRDGGPARI